MNCYELTEKYIKGGEDSMGAWWWARNPENPESPAYDVKQVKQAEKIKKELGITYWGIKMNLLLYGEILMVGMIVIGVILLWLNTRD